MLNSALKRSFDIIFSFFGLSVFGFLILIAWIFASVDTKSNGFFLQKRVGKEGKLFSVIKIKTMKPVDGFNTSVTSSSDPRITKTGAFFRRSKIDELPQLFNVLIGQMSFVGPRPDVPGYADKLQGDDRRILSLRPGITGPASIKYKDEEKILSLQENPEKYNNEVIYPDKVRINLEYLDSWSLLKDVQYIVATLR